MRAVYPWVVLLLLFLSSGCVGEQNQADVIEPQVTKAPTLAPLGTDAPSDPHLTAETKPPQTSEAPAPLVTRSFEECSKYYPVMESYPRQCRDEVSGETFTEVIDDTGEHVKDGRGPSHESQMSSSVSKERMELELWPVSPDCEEIPDLKFKNAPFDVENIYYIEPMGELTDHVAGHIIPGDHLAIQYNDEFKVSGVDFYALTDGYIVAVERHFYSPPAGYPEELKHYHIYFEHSCSLFTGYVHVSTLSQEILDADQDLKELDSGEITQHTNVWPRIPVKAGQKIGTAAAFDFVGMVTVDADVTLSGYSRPESYDGQLWRLHAVSPFDYFEEPLRTQLYDKIPRTAEPRGGKINFDIDGRLVGNWFEKDTNYLEGLNTERGTCGEWVCNYWDGHLAIVYDFILPDQIRINIGRSIGVREQGPYGVKGNSPDPADIGIEDGMVKYELVDLLDVSDDQGIQIRGKPIFTENDDKVLGVFLVQMLEEQTIKVEIFPGKTASGVTGFTDNAVIYVR